MGLSNYPPGFDPKALDGGLTLDDLPEQYNKVLCKIVIECGDDGEEVLRAEFPDTASAMQMADKAIEKYRNGILDMMESDTQY